MLQKLSKSQTIHRSPFSVAHSSYSDKRFHHQLPYIIYHVASVSILHPDALVHGIGKSLIFLGLTSIVQHTWVQSFLGHNHSPVSLWHPGCPEGLMLILLEFAVSYPVCISALTIFLLATSDWLQACCPFPGTPREHIWFSFLVYLYPLTSVHAVHSYIHRPYAYSKLEVTFVSICCSHTENY